MARGDRDIPEGVDAERLAELYAAPLGEFVARRNDLARELAAAQSKEASAWVKALPKPVATAWAVNRLARLRGDEMEALRESGDELRTAQATGDRDALRRLAEGRRERVESLVEAASAELESGGHQPSAQALQRVRRTLEAISAYGSATPLDPPVGRLHEDVEPPGIEALLGLAGALPVQPRAARAAPAAEPARKGRQAPAESAAERKAAAARRLELQRAATLAAERVEEARAAAREADLELERATARVDDAVRAVARQEERLREAKTTRDEAVQSRRAAEKTAAEAAKALAKRRAELASAQQRLR
jgi:hypothetical protein